MTKKMIAVRSLSWFCVLLLAVSSWGSFRLNLRVRSSSL